LTQTAAKLGAEMNDLIRSYRSLPVGHQVLVGSVTAIVALVVLFNLPHILGALIGIGFALVVLAFFLAILAGLAFAVFSIVRSLNRP
jgi:hypothetical protein